MNNLPRTSTFYGESYIPADLIVAVGCVNCGEVCEINEFLLFHVGKWDVPLCLECSKFEQEDPGWLGKDIFMEECNDCGEIHQEGECEATNGKMDQIGA